jgi:hypothetical protein
MILRTVAATALALGLAAPSAAALNEPEIFVRPQVAQSHTAAADWVPLASAPRIDFLGGWQIGYRLQPSGEPYERQRAALTFVSVPDGQPTQPRNEPPYCVGQAGTAGDIVPIGQEVQFEGNGAYTVKVSVGPFSGGASDCLNGPSTTGTFSVDVHVDPLRVGNSLLYQTKAPPTEERTGVHAPLPAGGLSQVVCARDATVQPDGAVTGDPVQPGVEWVYDDRLGRPGAWTCVARGTVEGVDANLETTVFATSWSAPLRFDLRSDFQRDRSAHIEPGRSRHPVIVIRAEFPEAAAGAMGTLALQRFSRCRGHKRVFKKEAPLRARFDSNGRVRFRVRRVGFYIAQVSISGARFYLDGTDPTELLLQPFKKRFTFGSLGYFPSCY